MGLPDPAGIDTVIYHGGCKDGMAAATAAYRRLGNKVDYIPYFFANGRIRNLKHKRIAALDCAFDEPLTKKLIQNNHAFVVIDHHDSKANVDVMAALPAGNKLFEPRQSGCTLAWNFFHPLTEIPPLFRLIEDQDVWRHAFAHSKFLNHALELEPLKLQHYNQLIDRGEAGVRALVEKGKVVHQVVEKQQKSCLTRTTMRRLQKFPDVKVAVVNAGFYKSQVGDYVLNNFNCKEMGRPDCVLIWDNRPNGVLCSLRSTNHTHAQQMAALLAGNNARALREDVEDRHTGDVGKGGDPRQNHQSRQITDSLHLLRGNLQRDATGEGNSSKRNAKSKGNITQPKNVDVASIAAAFGGGGHINAAAFKLGPDVHIHSLFLHR